MHDYSYLHMFSGSSLDRVNPVTVASSCMPTYCVDAEVYSHPLMIPEIASAFVRAIAIGVGLYEDQNS